MADMTPHEYPNDDSYFENLRLPGGTDWLSAESHNCEFSLCNKLWFYHSSYLKVQTMVEP
jgi:hypothetical protein